MSGYIEELERELVRAGREHQRRRARLRVVRWQVPRLDFSLGGAATAVSTLVTVAVVVLALGLVRGSQGGNRTAAPAGARQLVSVLAVLRRPQTSSDRGLSPSELRILSSNGKRVIPSLTRLVAKLPGIKIFVIVTTPHTLYDYESDPLWSGSLGDQVSLVASPLTTLQPAVPAAALNDPLRTGNWLITQRRYYVQLVPDHVASAKIAFGGGTVEARPVNNVIVVANPPAGQAEDVRSVTWYDRSGRVVPTSDKAWRQGMAALRAAYRGQFLARAQATPDRAPAALIEHFAVFAGTQHPVTDSGVTIWHPSLQSLPFGPLQTLNDPKAAREVQTSSGERFWVDPGPALMPSGPTGRPRWQTYICLIRTEGFATACSASLAQVLARGLWAIPYAPGKPSMLLGIVPDTNAMVILRLRGGGSRTAPVTHGVVVTLAAGVTAVLVKGINGAASVVPRPPVA